MRMAGSGGRAVVLLLTHFLVFAGSDFVGQSVEGEVEEGNYTYYTLKQTGDVRLELISIKGDADRRRHEVPDQVDQWINAVSVLEKRDGEKRGHDGRRRDQGFGKPRFHLALLFCCGI